MTVAKGQKYHVVTFDCYGTLIDWERGIRNTFECLLEKSLDPGSREDAMLFELYEQEERRIESERSFREYKEVMRLSAERVATKLGKTTQSGLEDAFAKELPNWKPFPETNAALEKVAVDHQLGILSNIDDDLLQQTMRQFTVPFDLIVTAQRVRSYKPNPRHFEEAKRLIGPNKNWLHVAASLYHDIAPASTLGIPSVWVNRHGSPLEKVTAGQLVKEVRTLAELPDWLDRQERS